MYSFLLQPRWLRLIAAAVVVAAGCVVLGNWQVDRLSQRHERNELIRRHLGAHPVPLEDAARPRQELSQSEQWRPIKTGGRYDDRRRLLVRNRVHQGKPGYYVLTPLVTANGPALLVNRGWVPMGRDARTPPDVPPAPAGVVTVVARLRPTEPPADGAFGPPGQVRRIDVSAIAKTLPYDVYGGFADLIKEDPRPAHAPRPVPGPEVTEGPHLAYALQWFVFAVIALVGVALLARREARDTPGTMRSQVAARSKR